MADLLDGTSYDLSVESDPDGNWSPVNDGALDTPPELAGLPFEHGARLERVLVVPVRFADRASSCNSDELRTLLFTGAEGWSVGEVFASASFGQVLVEGEVVDELALPAAPSGCAPGVWAEEADRRLEERGLELGAFTRVMYLLPRVGCNFAGLAEVGGRRSWYNGTCSSRTLFAHELAHNLGLHHAGSPTWEYGDDSDPAGNIAGHLRGFNAPHLYGLGLAKAGWTYVLEHDGQLEISPLAAPEGTSGPEPRMARLPRSSTDLYFSLRQPLSHDSQLRDAHLGRVSVHSASRAWPAGRTTLLASLAEGESHQDPETGARITVESVTIDRAVLGVEYECLAAPLLAALEPPVLFASLEGTNRLSLRLSNHSTRACPPERRIIRTHAPAGWRASPSESSIELRSGETILTVLGLELPPDATSGRYGVSVELSREPGEKAQLVSAEVWLDRDPPTAPEWISAILVGTEQRDVELSFGPAQDEFEVEKYLIYRSGQLVGATRETSFTEFGLPQGEHDYTVVAQDASGNVSEPSPTATVLVRGARLPW